MEPDKKISSANKSAYFLIVTASLTFIVSILFGLFLGSRINLFYTTLLSSSSEISNCLSRSKIDISSNFSEKTLKQALESLQIAELNVNQLAVEKSRLILFPISSADEKLSFDIQRLQSSLLEYKELSNRISTLDTAGSSTLIDRWTALGIELDAQSKIVQLELKMIIFKYDQIFRINQLLMMITGLLLCIASIFVIYKYKRERSYFYKTLEDTTKDVQKSIHKSTKVEEALIESQRRYSILIQNLPGMVYRCKTGSEWKFDFVSDKCLALTGYKPEELTNNSKLSYHDLIHPDDKKGVISQIQTSTEGKRPYQLVYRIKTVGEYEKWVWEQGTGIFSENDELVAIEGFIIDITEQKTGEDQLNVQISALEATVNGIVILDGDGNVLWCNTAFTNLTGYSLKELLGRDLTILKAKNYPSEYYDFMWNTAISGKSWHGELVNRRKDGVEYNEEMTITSIKDADGKIKYFVAVKLDITDRKKGEEALRESELRFRGLYENATIGIYRTSVNGKILLANPTLVKILGYESFEDLAKINSFETYVEPTAGKIFKNEIAVFGKVLGFESKWRKKDGSIIFVRESGRATKDENGRVLYYEGTIEDISEKKKIEEALIKAKERAELSDRLKSDFLTQMSHEIRTPLNALLGFIGVVKEELRDQVDDEMGGIFTAMESEGKRIMRTIELILNMSELQTGSYSFHPKRINVLDDVILYNHRKFQPLAVDKNILIELKSLNEDTFIEADEYSVNQIFHHLLDNAVKYTSTGKISIIIDRDENNNLFVDIVDSGIGIGEEYIPLLFTPFTREERGYTRNFEGNGLGLALVKKYCDLNGAEIKVVSSKGVGTTFRVTFSKKNEPVFS